MEVIRRPAEIAASSKPPSVARCGATASSEWAFADRKISPGATPSYQIEVYFISNAVFPLP
jgi:hypothetical protein